MFWTIKRIKEANASAAKYFFAPDTMRFFDSHVLHTVYEGNGGIFFVTSERCTIRNFSSPRKYTVREFDPLSGNVFTYGPFNEYDRRTAHKVAKLASQRRKK
jgi:hypothetical protein